MHSQTASKHAGISLINIVPGRALFRFCMAVILSGLLSAAPLTAGPVNIPGIGGAAYDLKVHSKKEARRDTVIMQKHDYSCGSAAVATLLTYHYDTPTPEAKVYEEMYRTGDEHKIKTEGFSLLDMKRYLDNHGFNGGGFRMNLDQFAKIGVPGIAMINTKGYKHFVVVKGVEGDRVLLGDPATGTTVVTREKFESIWNGAILAARNQVDLARSNFNDDEDWRSWPGSPLADAVDRSSLGSFTINLPGQNESGR